MTKYLGTTSVALALLASGALAEGVERTTQSMGVLFEEGRYLEFGLVTVSPSISGTGLAVIGGGSSGDMSDSYLNFGAAYKADLNDTWSYAIIYDQPFGADVTYPLVPYLFAGSTATLRTHALTGVLQYNMPSNVSIHGGVRAQTLQADVFLSAPGAIPGGTYTANGARDLAFGYLIGAAYEKPEIALRVALTYNSNINHELDTLENGAPSLPTEIETPKSINLEFQSGVAEDTLVFGSIRWVDWTAFQIAPFGYVGAVGVPIVSYADDRITYTLGVGRRLNETWSVAGSLSFEESTGSLTGNLGPKDGKLGATLAAIYRKDNMKITGGISYVDLGDATSKVGAATPAASFTGNSAIAAGIKVGFTF